MSCLTNICQTISLIICLQSVTEGSERMDYTISRLWDNSSVSDTDRIDLHLQYIGTNQSQYLQINTSAPYYDDPKIGDNITVGSTDGLWNYEVVEVFLLGADDHYLEIELGPKGHYLLLKLHGYRNVTQTGLKLDNYSAFIDQSAKRWTGTALIPLAYLPKGLSKFNAYAIHGSGEQRKYLSLFPTPSGKYKDPDFHRLEYFGDFDLKLE